MTEPPERTTPRFYVTPRQPMRPGTVLLAVAIATGLMFAARSALSHGGHTHRHGHGGGSGHAGAASGAGAGSASDEDDEDDDDPSRVDTVYLGDPAEAPAPSRHAARLQQAEHPETVHPFRVVNLPRSGEREGLIPDTPTGRLLYAWLAAFNKADGPALAQALPTAAGTASMAAQLELRKETGGFSLLSSKEVEPGVLVFRMRDQTPAATEALGTLRMQPGSNPPAVQSFSLRAIPAPPPSPGAAGESGAGDGPK